MSRTHDPLEISRVPIASLILDPSNARKHNPKNIDAIKASLTKFGQVEPLVINKRTGIVIGGNGRVEAMKALGWSEASVVHVDLDNTQAAALGVALNRTSELAEWDKDILGSLLHGLQEDGLNLAEIGFDLTDLPNYSPDFGAGSADDQGKLDEKAKITCPECGHEFAP